jgi:hypothetical protein
VAWFVIPLIVFLHQSIVVKGAAGRLLLDPLNDRGQLGQPSRSWRTGLRHRVDSFITARLAVNFFGIVLEILFWLVLKGSEGTHATVGSETQLGFSYHFVVHWWRLYMIVGTVRVIEMSHYFMASVSIAGSLFDVVTQRPGSIGVNGLISVVLVECMFIWSIRRLQERDKTRESPVVWRSMTL